MNFNVKFHWIDICNTYLRKFGTVSKNFCEENWSLRVKAFSMEFLNLLII